MASQKNTPLTHVVISLLVITIIIGLAIQKKASFLSTPINFIITPLRYPFLAIRSHTDNQLEVINNIPHQQRIIADLERQNAQLSLLAQSASELKSENASLKSLLSANITPNHQVISARVVGVSRYATIDRGSNVGIAESMPVVVDDNLVGIIVRVSTNTSQIRLLTDPDTNINATTLSNSSGILAFNHNTLQLTQVPQKNALKTEDPVYTTGSDLIPAGLLIGKITQINSSDSNIYQSATIEPTTTITQHKNVFVILD